MSKQHSYNVCVELGLNCVNIHSVSILIVLTWLMLYRDCRQKWLNQLRSLDTNEDTKKDLKEQIQHSTDAMNAEVAKLIKEKEKEIQSA